MRVKYSYAAEGIESGTISSSNKCCRLRKNIQEANDQAPDVPKLVNRGSLWPIDTVRHVANATTRMRTKKHMATISTKMSQMAPTMRLNTLLMRRK